MVDGFKERLMTNDATRTVDAEDDDDASSS